MLTLLFHPRLSDCRRLFLRNYEIPVKIGVNDSEKNGTQRLFVNVDLYVPLAISTPTKDLLSEVVDYNLIRNTLVEYAAKGHINLQETLCDDIARLLLAHNSVRAVKVSTEKPDVYDDCDGIGVEVFHIKQDM